MNLLPPTSVFVIVVTQFRVFLDTDVHVCVPKSRSSLMVRTFDIPFLEPFHSQRFHYGTLSTRRVQPIRQRGDLWHLIVSVLSGNVSL
jgi:hypothetical protein